jgi:hypothetical protein
MKHQALQRQDQANDPITRKTERLETLLEGIAEDARQLAGRYSRETIVPEGGE